VQQQRATEERGLFIIAFRWWLAAPVTARRAKFHIEAPAMAQTSAASIPALKDTFGQVRSRMDKAVEDFRAELAAMRTGRANVHMLDSVHVDAYGSQMPLSQVATVHAAEAQLITVQPWDPSLLGAIEKSIRIADLGLNPMNDGKLIRVPVPALTEERRKDLVKHLHKVLEEHRTAVRNVRRDGIDSVKKATKDKKITEDDERNAQDSLQKLTDDEIKKMEEMAKAKEKEMMQV
jgi:ribosome recycling factor